MSRSPTIRLLRRAALRGVAALCALVLTGCAELGSANLDQVLGAVLTASGSQAPLSESTVAAGLKEALTIGSQNASSETSRVDGFLGNALIRISTPPELDRMAQGLRTIGLGSQVDQLEVAMNRAAEQAAGEARDVFVTAVSNMTIQDALGILRGPDDAATRYMRRTTGGELEARFSPIVDAKMRQVGLVRLYDDLLARWRRIPLAPEPQLDLRQHVTQGALDGIFTTLAQEEKKIRTDPAARVTDLLRTVFR